MTFLVIENCKK